VDFKNFLKKIKQSEQTLSTIFGMVVVIVIGTLVIRHFQGIGEKQYLNLKEKQEGEIEETVETPAETTGRFHTIKKGENLWTIALQYYGSGYNWVDIAKKNNLNNPNLVEPGQKLEIPDVKKVIISSKTQANPIVSDRYTVVKGDCLWEIAVRAYGDGYRWPEIARANKLSNPNLIHSGNVLVIPR